MRRRTSAHASQPRRDLEPAQRRLWSLLARRAPGTEETARRRARVLGTAAVLFIAFVGFAALTPDSERDSWDARLSRYIHSFQEDGSLENAAFGLVLHPVVQLLGVVVLVTLPLLPHQRERRRLALFLGLTVAGALVLEPALKALVERPPVDGPIDSYSYPSGHAMRSAAGAVALVLAVGSQPLRRGAAVAGAVLVVAIGVAVVYHEWHWVSDVLGGWCIGAAWVAVLYVLIGPGAASRAVGRDGCQRTAAAVS